MPFEKSTRDNAAVLGERYHPCEHYRSDLFDSAECEGMAKLIADERGNAGLIQSSRGSAISASRIRRATVCAIPDGLRSNWIYEKLLNHLRKSNECRWRYDVSVVEPLQYVSHAPGGHYVWHTDVGPGALALRKLSFSVQLTSGDKYVGGSLQFREVGGTVSAPRRLGSLTVFPSFMLHRVKPVFWGTRIALVGWLLGDSPIK